MTILQEAAEGGLTLQRVLSNIPHDAGAHGNRARPKHETLSVQHDTRG